MRHFFFVLTTCALLVRGTVVLAAEQPVTTISQLLDLVSRQPAVTLRELQVEESRQERAQTTARLYPKGSLFGRGEIYNSPTNLRPMYPTEVNVSGGDDIPFSEEIIRYGLKLSMPLYMREIYLLREKGALVTEQRVLEQKLDLLTRQAGVVSANSSLSYLDNLILAIKGRRKALEQTRADIRLKVRNGRTPESELLKIDSSLDSLALQLDEVKTRRVSVLQQLEELTGCQLQGPIPMELRQLPKEGRILKLELAEKQVQTAKKEVQRRKSASLPSLSLEGAITGNEGWAYNTDNHIHRTYNSGALVLQFPLFDKSLSSDTERARIQYRMARKQLEQARLEVNSLKRSFENQLKIAERSVKNAQRAVANNQKLVKISTISIRTGRTTMEDYLGYESDLLNSQASLYLARQQQWQVIARQAALFGNNLKEIVK